MKYINTGKQPDDGTGNSLHEAFTKINENFEEIYNKLKIKEPFRVIIWRDLADTEKAMNDINYNFELIELWKKI